VEVGMGVKSLQCCQPQYSSNSEPQGGQHALKYDYVFKNLYLKLFSHLSQN